MNIINEWNIDNEMINNNKNTFNNNNVINLEEENEPNTLIKKAKVHLTCK